ncbi:hypothetical protein JCM19236_3801 [Vibrio sp. JCM 19236]|nr:hypothetical protein JCM19236_3801 [Vibrio sp. JCM 19236]
MTALRKQDEDRQLLLVDIHEQQFLDYPYIDGKEASAMLHAWMKTVSCC